jgi:hypothetical protein
MLRFYGSRQDPDCVALAETEGESSYTELITCMEMARDVRKLHSDANSLSEQNYHRRRHCARRSNKEGLSHQA